VCGLEVDLVTGRTTVSGRNAGRALEFVA